MPDPSDQDRTLYLIDGTNCLFRAFFAIRGLSTRSGTPTNAIYGFTMMLRKILREKTPHLMAVAFDRKEPTFRHRVYADYKANRAETPDELITQIPYVRRVCEVLGVAFIDLPGFEADDVIGTLTERARRSGYDVIIVSTDKDLLQLVGERVRVYNPAREEILDGDAVERFFGVRPGQVRDVLALSGDHSDNVPGVPGIGDKGARKLVRQYGDLEGVLAAAAEVTEKRYREGLQAHAEAARMSRELVTLCLDAPVDASPGSLEVAEPDPDAARALFEELEFDALAREFAASPPAASPEPIMHRVILDAGDLERAVAALRGGGVVAFNLERDQREPMRAAVVGISLAGADTPGLYVPLAHRHLGTPRQIDPGRALQLLAPLFEDPGIARVGHNVKADRIMLRRLGVRVEAHGFDSMIASYLLDSSRRSHALEVVGEEVAGLTIPSYEPLLGSGARSTPLAEVPVDAAAAVVCPRACAMVQLRGHLQAALGHAGLLSLMQEMEMPLMDVLAHMEAAGVRIDTAFLGELAGRWEKEMARLTEEIHGDAGTVFNINSPRQLGEILFDRLKLSPGRKTRKTRTFSTGVEVLEELAAQHSLPRLVLEYRALQKLKSTYIDSLPQLVNPDTGRVHTSFNQTVAATGRLSSSDPNLQNIPIRSELGRQIRRAFIPADGFLLLSADYSQIELRVLAHLCADPALVDAFRMGEDIHRRTAAEIFGVHPGLVTDEMRRRAKAVNFGIIYGMGPQRLARDQGMGLKEATTFIAEYFARFPRVKTYIDETIAAARRDGFVRTLFQRIRYLPEIRASDRNMQQQAVRAAVNSVIQGTAADLIKMAMVALSHRISETGSRARLTLQVHDELVLEVPVAEGEAVAVMVRQTMESVHPLRVPLTTDLHIGPTWIDMEDLPRLQN